MQGRNKKPLRHSIDSLLLSVLIFVTNLFDNCIVLCLSYTIFFDKFIGLKINAAIILNKSLPEDFYVMFLTFIEFPTIIASLILWVFFFSKFSIKSTFLKVKGRFIHQNRFAYVNIFATFIACTFFTDKFLINSFDKFWYFFADFGGEKTALVCEKTILMRSFFSQWLPDSACWGVADSPSWRVVFRLLISINGNVKEIISSLFDF